MAVVYPQGGGGGGGFNPFGVLSALSLLMPGSQAVTPWLSGAGALTSTLQGDPAEAVKYGAGLIGRNMASKRSVFDEPPIEPTLTMGEADVRKYLSDNNPMASTAVADTATPDITANQRMLNGTESAMPWSAADEGKYNALLAQYGMGGKQAVGENADMGTRFADNNLVGQRRSDVDYRNRYNELLSQYDMSNMDWTKRRQMRKVI